MHIHVAVMVLMALPLAAAFRSWAVVLIPVVVSLYVGFIFRSCPYRTEVIAVSLFVGNLALVYKVAELMLHSFAQSI